MVRTKKYRVALHLLVWLSIPLALTLIRWTYQFTRFPPHVFKIESFAKMLTDQRYTDIIVLAVGSLAFYTTSVGLLPAMGRKKGGMVRVVMYSALLLVLPGVVVEVLVYCFPLSMGLLFKFFLLTAYIALIPFILLGVLSWAIKKWGHSDRLKAELETKQIRTELELLRSQTNPHFLFNTINNIDTLIRANAELASVYLNELSDLLRFILYESGGERIPLQNEVMYMHKYINLQKIRSVNPDFIHFTVSGDLNGWEIAPMLLMPVLENAFKHVSAKTMDKAIDAELTVAPLSLLFRCRNVFSEGMIHKSGKGGLGTHLLKQRLDLIYKDSYQLETAKTGNYYEVVLKIDLDAH
jgi:two-component system, LytTR family, sensor kinase